MFARKKVAAMVIAAQPDPIDNFERFTELPENSDKLFELIGGQIVEVISRPYASSLIAGINLYLQLYVRPRDLGHITGKKGGYVVSGDCYIPDLAFISKQRQPRLPYRGYLRNPPELVVEISSPKDADFQHDLRMKIANYLSAGTVVWVFVVESKHVEVYVPGQPVKILGVNDTLDGGDVLPGFTLAVKDIFPEEQKES